MNNQNLRFYIQVRVKLGINALEIFNELKTVFSSNTPSLSTIYRWINVFESGSDRIEDLHRAGRPISESTKANIDKTMVTVFFRSSGVVSLSYLDKGKSINNISYVEDCLKPLVTAIEDVRPTLGCKNLKFHHDNARPHVHSSVKTYLKEQNFIIMEHPPYSPDLAPSDFWLFDYIKKRLTTQPNAESLFKQISEIVNSIPKDEYNKTFIKWKERMELCIKNQGNYFEHLIK